MTWCKKCLDKYYTNGGISYGEIRLCDHCNKEWEIYYHNYKMIRFPDGTPFYWLSFSEAEDRDKLFKEWIKPLEVGCYWCKYRKGFKCSGYSCDHKIYNEYVAGYKMVEKEIDLIKIITGIKSNRYEEYGKPYGYLCNRFKKKIFMFR